MKNFLDIVKWRLMIREYENKNIRKKDIMKLKEMYKNCKNKNLKSELLLYFYRLRNYNLGGR